MGDHKDEKLKLLELFNEINVAGNGVIFKKEMTDYLTKCFPDLQKSNLKKLVKEIGFQENKELNFSDFLLLVFNFEKMLTDEKILSLFQ